MQQRGLQVLPQWGEVRKPCLIRLHCTTSLLSSGGEFLPAPSAQALQKKAPLDASAKFSGYFIFFEPLLNVSLEFDRLCFVSFLLNRVQT